MKAITLKTLTVYFLVIALFVVLPGTAEEYNVLPWEVLLAQVFAIPLALLAFVVSYVIHKKKIDKEK